MWLESGIGCYGGCYNSILPFGYLFWSEFLPVDGHECQNFNKVTIWCMFVVKTCEFLIFVPNICRSLIETPTSIPVIYLVLAFFMAFSWFCIVFAAVVSFAREPTCLLQMAPPNSMNQVNTLKIAVYTENIGGYDEVRMEDIPSVPSGMDAFYFADSETLKKHEDAFALWRKNGWTTMEYRDMQQGTKQVSGQRLTAKKVKFDPPDWITEGKWDWLVHFDAQKCVRLEQLPSFIQKRSNASLILQDWCHRVVRAATKADLHVSKRKQTCSGEVISTRIENASQEYFQWVSDVTEMVKIPPCRYRITLKQYSHAKLEKQIQW